MQRLFHMDQAHRNKSILKKYIPEPAVDTIAEWIYTYNFKLKVKKPRSSREGDYTAPYSGKNHVITVNRDLNKYAFLITLIHEIAHLITWEKYKGSVSPHGKEWKSEYSKLLNYFLLKEKSTDQEESLFPREISSILHTHSQRPSAASCSDIHLSRALRKFDSDTETLLLEKISADSSFRIVSIKTKHSREIFIKGEKRRTRFKCIHARTKREYLIHALCKVVLCPANPPEERA
ncbi:MAG: sprT domain-containing protein [Bacteroidetes bacterium]|nr:MAG: sprT domain-containing protein [Bacteroidota bacterium]